MILVLPKMYRFFFMYLSIGVLTVTIFLLLLIFYAGHRDYGGNYYSCSGKPSVGKSTFFYVNDTKTAKKNYPFTTIEPNTGISYFKSRVL